MDLAGLPITAGLRDRLEAWNALADRVLSANDYQWPDASTESEFIATGSALARELRDELGIEVIYTPDGDIDEALPLERKLETGGNYGWYAHTPLSGEIFRPHRPENFGDEA